MGGSKTQFIAPAKRFDPFDGDVNQWACENAALEWLYALIVQGHREEREVDGDAVAPVPSDSRHRWSTGSVLRCKRDSHSAQSKSQQEATVRVLALLRDSTVNVWQRPALENLDLNSESTFFAPLCASTVTALYPFRFTVVVDVFFVSPFLPHTLPGLFPEVAKTIFKLLGLLSTLFGDTPLVFRVKRFGRSPLLPGKVLDLVTQEQHHVIPGGMVRICFQEMREEFLISQFGY